MGNKTKSQIIASNPDELNPSDLKKYNNWKGQGTGPSGAGKKIKDAVLSVASTPLSLELDQETEDAILLQQAKDDIERNANKSAVVTYNNKTNVWRLIQRTYNATLGTEKLVLAMSMGKSGVMIMVSDKTDSKVAMSTCYMQD